jgi:hypothetical protein
MAIKVLRTVTKEEKDSMVLINTKLTCAEQALSVIPPGLEDNDARNYVKGCIDSLAEYRWLEKDWWDEMRKVYNLPEKDYFEVFLDFSTGDLYIETED